MALDRPTPAGEEVRDEPPSPCVGICDVDWASRACLGCGRTLEEIGAWPTASAAEKRRILERLTAESEDGPP